jgi:hypothetical protein
VCEEGYSVRPASAVELDVPRGPLSIAYRLLGSGAEWKHVTADARLDELARVLLEP